MERLPKERCELAFPLRRALPPAKEQPGACGPTSPWRPTSP